jgi:TetR/AcrR family transcriptional regulator, regulator of cefoperazone and chloramphenicol sensitivity
MRRTADSRAVDCSGGDRLRLSDRYYIYRSIWPSLSIDRHCGNSRLSSSRFMAIQKIKARGEDTRNRLLEVATRLFSDRGFEAVSTREIASEANTTLPSIPHHFGSKEGLYQAVILRIAEEMTKQLSPASAVALAILSRQNASRKARIDALENLVLTHARALLQNRSEWAQLIVREQLRPTAALVPIIEVLEQHLIGPIIRLIASLTHISSEGSEAKLKAMTLLGRVLIFRLAKTSLFSIMGWQDLTPARINLILELLRKEVRSTFSG